MTLNVVDNPEKNRFEAEVDGVLAIAEYQVSGDTITFTHTEVPSHHRGKGIGEELAGQALDMVRERNLKVVPRCKFIAAFIEKHPEYRDMLA
jgi:predicted GNAT family acetyltransferase